jgi:uncharacterized membrane protein YgcG
VAYLQYAATASAADMPSTPQLWRNRVGLGKRALRTTLDQQLYVHRATRQNANLSPAARAAAASRRRAASSAAPWSSGGWGGSSGSWGGGGSDSGGGGFSGGGGDFGGGGSSGSW